MYHLIQEVKTILRYTNAIPYKSNAHCYFCMYCYNNGPTFKDPGELKTHTRTCHAFDRTSKIEFALRPYKMNETVKLDIENLTCNVCLITIPKWNELFTHLKELHEIVLDQAHTRVIPYILGNDFKCALCGEVYQNYMQLDGHMNSHYNNYVCDDCGDTYLAASRLKHHQKIHERGKYCCTQCPKVFSLEKYRKKHVELIHKQILRFKCYYCEERFVNEYPRHAHIVAKHKEKVKVITCKFCDKTYTWRSDYNAHVRKRHTDDPNKYKCEECGKKFFRPFQLKDHMLRHTREKHFPCKICNKMMVSPFALKDHIYWHKKHDKKKKMTEDV